MRGFEPEDSRQLLRVNRRVAYAKERVIGAHEDNLSKRLSGPRDTIHPKRRGFREILVSVDGPAAGVREPEAPAGGIPKGRNGDDARNDRSRPHDLAAGRLDGGECPVAVEYPEVTGIFGRILARAAPTAADALAIGTSRSRSRALS